MVGTLQACGGSSGAADPESATAVAGQTQVAGNTPVPPAVQAQADGSTTPAAPASSGSQTSAAASTSPTSSPSSTSSTESTTPTTPTTPTSPTQGGGSTPPAAAPACVDGASFTCSGSSVLARVAGVAATSSGVQVVARSTSDVAPVNPSVITAWGLAPLASGLADVRMSRAADRSPNAVHLLLDGLGLSWDGRNERPRIIEVFDPTAGRSALDSSGAVVAMPLPDPLALAFYDAAARGAGGSQAHYANNRYFPRSLASRCPDGMSSCPTAETSGLGVSRGTWRSGGTAEDLATATRFHEDGDVHAGAADTSGTPLAGGNGLGVPYPGSKGYRAVKVWSYADSALLHWTSQDTVQIYEWGAFPEHNTVRQGLVAFGTPTDPAALPATGSVTYGGGRVRGRYARDAGASDMEFVGTVTVTVDFGASRITVVVSGVTDPSGNALPISFTSTGALPSQGDKGLVNASVTAGGMVGGLGLRMFGGVGGTAPALGPAEVGATFSLNDPGTGATAIGGFVLRRR